MLNVFVAGPSADLERCENAVWRVRVFGIVTFDWPAQVRRTRDAGIQDDTLTMPERQQIKRDCLEGIRKANVVLWLSGGSSEGASYEAGYAEALGKPVVVAGRLHPIYGDTLTPEGLCFPTDAQALAYLEAVAVALAIQQP